MQTNDKMIPPRHNFNFPWDRVLAYLNLSNTEVQKYSVIEDFLYKGKEENISQLTYKQAVYASLISDEYYKYGYANRKALAKTFNLSSGDAFYKLVKPVTEVIKLLNKKQRPVSPKNVRENLKAAMNHFKALGDFKNEIKARKYLELVNTWLDD